VSAAVVCFVIRRRPLLPEFLTRRWRLPSVPEGGYHDGLWRPKRSIQHLSADQASTGKASTNSVFARCGENRPRTILASSDTLRQTSP